MTNRPRPDASTGPRGERRAKHSRTPRDRAKATWICAHWIIPALQRFAPQRRLGRIAFARDTLARYRRLAAIGMSSNIRTCRPGLRNAIGEAHHLCGTRRARSYLPD